MVEGGQRIDDFVYGAPDISRYIIGISVSGRRVSQKKKKKNQNDYME
jgi:hypothetical protein